MRDIPGQAVAKNDFTIHYKCTFGRHVDTTPRKAMHFNCISNLHSKTKGFEVEERLVYQIIEDAGNKGCVY